MDVLNKPKNYLLSIIVPVYNEEQSIVHCVERLLAAVGKLGCSYELIFVNDGSTDNSLALLREEKGKDARIRIINLSRNFGHQIAVTAGLDHCQGDASIIIDADLQDPPELFAALIEKWQDGNDIVHARRRNRSGESKFKRWTAKAYYRLLKKISNVEIPVDVGDFRLMNKSSVLAFRQLRERHRYVRGLIAWLGYKQDFVEYDRDQRYAGVSKYPLLKMLRFSFDGIASFSILPLRVASACGVLCAIAAACYTIYALYVKFVLKQAVIGWTSIIIAVLFIGGIQLICLGIIGEYVGILYEESKGRPLYLVNEID
jgi:polyisoprenyl-phosphate glycosyltransferase